MTRRDKEERALDALIEEARADLGATPDWPAVEERLFARLETEGGGNKAVGSGSRRNWPAVLAIAATLASGAVWLGTGPGVPSRSGDVAVRGAETPVAHDAKNGSALAVGTRVTAGDQSVTVEHAGHVTWTLEPHSAARVESVGDVVAIELEGGAVTARVVKSPRPESFVVRVEHTRVAVHGTEFRVARVGDRVQVDVREGIVAVGPVGGTAFPLPAPGAATLTFDGVRLDAPKPPPAGAAPPEAAPSRDGVETVAAGSAVPSKERARTSPSPATVAREASRDVDAVFAAVRSCFADETIPRGDIRVMVRTDVSLRVEPSGVVSGVQFTPPLAPYVRTCVDRAVANVHFSPSNEARTFDRTLDLER